LELELKLLPKLKLEFETRLKIVAINNVLPLKTARRDAIAYLKPS